MRTCGSGAGLSAQRRGRRAWQYPRESSDTCVTSVGLPGAWVTSFSIETCLWVPHLQWLVAMTMSQLLGGTG